MVLLKEDTGRRFAALEGRVEKLEKSLEELKKVRHEQPMLSLDSILDQADVLAFDQRMKRELDAASVAYTAEPKFDGLSVELLYENGLFIRGATRGDGTTGEDVTQNIKTVEAVPLRLRNDDRPVPPIVLVRGEVFLPKSEFKRINEESEAAGRKTHANPRNLAAGTIRQLDPAITAGRKLSFYAWSVVDEHGTYGNAFPTHDAEFEALHDWGIRANPNDCQLPSLQSHPRLTGITNKLTRC